MLAEETEEAAGFIRQKQTGPISTKMKAESCNQREFNLCR